MSSLFGLFGGLANPTAAPGASFAAPAGAPSQPFSLQPAHESGDSEVLRKVQTSRTTQTRL